MSTCHWCHVMERESFEDEEVAAVLNAHYVSIKVDREERPDIDHIYMAVCQAMTGHGGWPLTVLLTPDKKPFYSGTYFPKNSKYGRPGIMDVLTKIANIWENERERVLESAEKITNALKPKFGSTAGDMVTMDTMDKAFELYVNSFDNTYGGFGSEPKFPSPHNLSFLMRYYKETGKRQALDMVLKTLDSMHAGGIYDHLGYGFSRYSVDRKWLVPHFEKMLYDNALLSIAYLEAYQITREEKYARVAREIFTYVSRDMTSPEGGFYSAEDADSEGVEGKFYIWSPDEIKQILGEEDGELFCDYYNVTPEGNFEGHSILNLIGQDTEKFLAGKDINAEEFERKLAHWRERLFEERDKRIHPHKDDKILTAWNGLMIAAFSKGAQVLREQQLLKQAEQSVRFIFNKLVREDGRLLARYRDGEAAYPAYADDYAFLIWGLIELYQASFDTKHLKQAIDLHEEMIRLFWDEEDGGLYFYGADSEELIARPKEIYDGAMPSGNSAAVLNTLRLARITGRADLEELAEKMIRAYSGDITHYPPGYSHFLMGCLFAIGKSKEIVIAGSLQNGDTQDMLQVIRSQFLPHAVVIVKQVDDGLLDELAPYTQEHKSLNGQATAYICENFSCRSPVTELESLKHL